MTQPPTPDSLAIARARKTSPLTTSQKIKRLLWSFVQSTLYRGSFHTWSSWRATLLRLFGAQIGHHCIIRRTTRVYYPWLLTVGDSAVIGDQAEIYNLGHVTIGKRVTISQQSYICAGTHDYDLLAFPVIPMPITIHDDAWICARAFLSPGITVGPGAIVAACAVATKDVPPWTIVGGNPAKFIKNRERPQ